MGALLLLYKYNYIRASLFLQTVQMPVFFFFTMCKFYYCFLLMLVFLCQCVNARINIYVNTQEDFNNISSNITAAINSGEKNIFVQISPNKQYIAKEKHVMLGWLNAPDVSVYIRGNGAVIIPEGKCYFDEECYTGVFSFDNSWMYGERDIPLWTYFDYAQGLVEIIDVNKKKCRLKTAKQQFSGVDSQNIFILIPEWCQTGIYKVDRIDDGFIYFTANDLKKSYNNGYVVNDDYNYGNKEIRYKLCNIDDKNILRIINRRIFIPEETRYVREGFIHNYITIQSSAFKKIDISDLEFRGNSYKDSQPSIFICDSKCNSIQIRNCKFIGMHGTVISIEMTSNVSVKNNLFKDCYYYGVYSDNCSENTSITNNNFESMGKRMQCSFCITCRGENYYVAKNVIKDYGYGGIGVGVWHGSPQSRPSKGVVEQNELFYSEKYLQDVLNNCIMDGGAIYVWTKNDGAIIRNNYIHDISGIKDNRGIFCDDGASNFLIYGNVIENIANSFCIDSRRVASVERTVGTSNINNKIYGNIVDGRIRFQGNEKENNGCVLGVNYILVKKGQLVPNSIYSNVHKDQKDIIIDYSKNKKGLVGMSRQDYQNLKKKTEWKSIKHYFMRKNR